MNPDPDTLPPSSRFTCRMTDEAMVIEATGSSGHWGWPALLGFLGITFITQGILQTHASLRGGAWIIAGAMLLLIAWLLAWRNLRKMQRHATLRIDRQSIRIEGQSTWRREEIASLSVEKIRRRWAIRLRKTTGSDESMLRGFPQDELQWVVRQIQRRWNDPALKADAADTARP